MPLAHYCIASNMHVCHMFVDIKDLIHASLPTMEDIS